jgi:hypothetical protein
MDDPNGASSLSGESWWRSAWDERGSAMKQELGQLTPPDTVTSFSWDDPRLIIPGACALTFAPTERRSSYLITSMGMTQPTNKGDDGNEFELALNVPQPSSWCYRLVYDLLTGWKLYGSLSRGQLLPLSMFKAATGELDCVAGEVPPEYQRVTEMRGLLLWPDRINRQLFEVSTGAFFLMAVTLITADEITLVGESSPPHVLLLLKRMGFGQVSDPQRSSVTEHPMFDATWREVKAMHHNDAFMQLNK